MATLTNADEDYLLNMVLDETTDSSPTDFQQLCENEAYSQPTDVFNLFNAGTGSGDSVNAFVSSIFTHKTFGFPQKRCAPSEGFELQGCDISKRKRLQRAQSKQDEIIDNEVPQNENSKLGDVVNDLVKRAFITDKQIEFMARNVIHNELEINGLKADKMKLSERVQRLEMKGLCCLCNTDQINIWVNPCQHWVMCIGCFKKQKEERDVNNMSMECPVCRQHIDFAVPYFGIHD